MRRAIFILLLLALHDPALTARMDSPSSSVVSWDAPTRVCLYYDGVPDQCYGPGSWRVTFGKTGPLSGELRPKVGGRYLLVDPLTDARWASPPLVGPVYLPAFP